MSELLHLLAPAHIDVCVCTHRRPHRLARLLRALESQRTDGRFVHAVIVVDNDPEASAAPVVRAFAARSRLTLRYAHEPEPNIARARNRAVSMARGTLVAMIDDDELPADDWLMQLLRTLVARRADGVLGPVRPQFEAPPPQWIVRGGFCERPSYPTGTLLTRPRQTRTGNLLIRRASLLAEPGPFDPAFGRTGGEDTDFFRRRLARGDVYVWCQEAPVWEGVPAARLTRRYFLQRALLRGVVNAERVSLLSLDVAKSVLAALVYSALLPVLAVARHDLFMHALVRDCDHLGKLLAVCGIRPVRERGP